MKQYHVMGSCHVDLAWQADEEEYACYLENLVVIVLDLLDRNPGMTYVIEQAYHYRSLKDKRPDLIERLKHYIQKGRIEVVGGMISTLETNIPTAESFIRNQLMGINWFKENMDADVKTAWLVDTFGCHAQVPQILKGFGFRQLMANRFGGEKAHDVFWAKGLDGSSILVAGRDVMSKNLPDPRKSRYFMKFVSNGEKLDGLFADALKSNMDGPIMLDAYLEDEWMPNRRYVRNFEQMQEALNKDGEGKASYSLPGVFFDALLKEGFDFPSEFSDLNPEFTGTFSQRIEIRMRNRQVEGLLLEAEQWTALLGVPRQPLLHDAWWDMGFVHFHDVFTGSHPDCVFQDVKRRLDSVESISLSAIHGALATSSITVEAGEILVSNALPFERADLVSIPAAGNTEYKVFDQNIEISSYVEEGRLHVECRMPECSTKILRITRDSKPVPENIPVSMMTLENEWVRLVISVSDGISLLDKCQDRWLLSGVRDILVLQDDSGSFQIENPTGAEWQCWNDAVRLEKLSSGRSALASGQYISSSGQTEASWSIKFSVHPAQQWIDAEVRVDWQTEGKRLRLKLNSDINGATEGIFEIPFGVVKRRAYVPAYNRKGEWPAQRFAAIQDERSGLALINDGVPGVEILGGTVYTSLLRAPTATYIHMMPDNTSSQHGNHVFKFALYPYSGDWKQSDVLRIAQRHNQPLRAYRSEGSKQIDSLLTIDQPNILLHTVKYPEDEKMGGIILRLAESSGIETSCEVNCKGAVKAACLNMMEDCAEELTIRDSKVSLSFKPHQIKTIWVSMEEQA